MTLNQLKYIVMVANKGSISETAKALFISQPNLTNSIKELEQEMNITLFIRTNKGDLFLGYARQILEQTYLLEEKFLNKKNRTTRFSVSCQHYSFAIKAFVSLITHFGGDYYDYTLRETQTYDIIDDLVNIKSEIGILYTYQDNETVIMNLLKHNHLTFVKLFDTTPHVFISSTHPLANKSVLTLEQLNNYPYFSFEQGEYNSFYYSEEMLSHVKRNKNIKVRDCATLFNLVIGLNGYIISSEIIDKDLNGQLIITKPLKEKEIMKIGIIRRKRYSIKPLCKSIH